MSLKDFISKIEIKNNFMYIVLDTGVDITKVPNKLIYDTMDNIARDAESKNILINLVVDTKNISMRTFNIQKFANIQNHFANNHIKYINHIYIANASGVFKAIQKLLNPLLDSRYKNKIQILD
jgi:hypothetical protein